MSKLLRLPLTLLAVLAALFFLPGIAWGDPPDCAADPTATGCTQSEGSDVVQGTVPDDQTVQAPVVLPQPPADTKATPLQTQQTPAGDAAARDAGTLAQLDVADPAPVVPLDLCTTFPQAPVCMGKNAPTVPLTCEGLAQVLGQTGGCPSSFSCEDLAQLLGLTCPAGPPDCQALADLFHLGGCPDTPKNCTDFAKLLGVQDCSQIPCMDTSQLPAQARDGLKPLFDGLAQIGIKECPVKPAGSSPPPGKGTYMPPAQAAAPPGVHYANCDDARAQGKAPVLSTDPGYRPELDSDHDGIGCEVDAVVVATTQPTGTLAYTGLDLGPQLNVAWTLLVLGAGMLIVGRRRA
jgi:hypothetical protein